MNVAEAVGRALAELGVKRAFGVVGSGNFHVTNALVRHGVPFVAARHEGGAVTMADAYARMSGGEVRFYKDGYTDLRGRFDYASLSTDELDRVERFALLVLHDEHGALIREAAPPKR